MTTDDINMGVTSGPKNWSQYESVKKTGASKHEFFLDRYNIKKPPVLYESVVKQLSFLAKLQN